MAEVTATTERFGHREHVHLTWLAVRRVGVPAAVGLVSDGIQRTARYAGVPQKYHATISRAWVDLFAYADAEGVKLRIDGTRGTGPPPPRGAPRPQGVRLRQEEAKHPRRTCE